MHAKCHQNVNLRLHDCRTASCTHCPLHYSRVPALADNERHGGCVGIAGINNDAPALGLIQSSAVNTNGRSSALTAPHGPSQQGLLRTALQSAGLQPSHVAALQMHSNGTPLGDPIEVGAAAAVLLQVGLYATLDF